MLSEEFVEVGAVFSSKLPRLGDVPLGDLKELNQVFFLELGLCIPEGLGTVQARRPALENDILVDDRSMRHGHRAFQ